MVTNMETAPSLGASKLTQDVFEMLGKQKCPEAAGTTHYKIRIKKNSTNVIRLVFIYAE